MSIIDIKCGEIPYFLTYHSQRKICCKRASPQQQNPTIQDLDLRCSSSNERITPTITLLTTITILHQLTPMICTICTMLAIVERAVDMLLEVVWALLLVLVSWKMVLLVLDLELQFNIRPFPNNSHFRQYRHEFSLF